jgi:DNA adenine methylase
LFRLLNEPSIHVNNFVCSDINGDLIDLWKAIKQNPDHLFKVYTKLWCEMNKMENKQDRRVFYELVRQEFNQIRDPNLFFFLMRVCTNGQPRYNKWCEFNQTLHLTRDGITPVRLKKVLYQWSQLLNDNNVEFIKCDYKDIFEKVGNEDFLYLDPPFQNERSTRYFCNFNYEDFFDRVGILNDMGVKYILSSDGKYVPDYCYENIIYLKGGGGSYQKTVEHKSTGHMYETIYLN